jgi:hypothetical protein
VKNKKTRNRQAAIFQFSLPSVKMKSNSPRGVVFGRELHAFLMENYGGYTVTGGSITGYWKQPDGSEECNEHRAYQVAIQKPRSIKRLQKFIVTLGLELGEQSIFCVTGGKVNSFPPTSKIKACRRTRGHRSKCKQEANMRLVCGAASIRCCEFRVFRFSRSTKGTTFLTDAFSRSRWRCPGLKRQKAIDRRHGDDCQSLLQLRRVPKPFRRIGIGHYPTKQQTAF